MTDRNVQYPTRYKLTKVDGTDDIYDMEPAPGTVTEEGTLLNKNTLLKDATASLYEIPPEQFPGVVPDDVFVAIRELLNSADDKINARTKIVKGSYVGDGSGTKSLIFEDEVDFLLVTGYWGTNTGYGLPNFTVILNPDQGGYGSSAAGRSNEITGNITKSGTTITWTGTSGVAPYSAGNAPGETYHYIAVAKGV